MPMTPHQRHMAAVKAAATRRRNLQHLHNAAAGHATPPPPPPPPPATPPANPWNAPPPPPPPTPAQPAAQPANGNNIWGRPKPTVENARAEVLVALENLYAIQCQATGITDDKRNAFEKYQKALTRALAPSTDILLRNEAETALRVAAMHLVKLTF
jgi:hypothetical protein